MANTTNGAINYDDKLYIEDGVYGDKTHTHGKCVVYAWPIIRNLLSSIPFTPGRGPFVICDYGTADGVNSISLMTNCVDWVQKTYGDDQQVHIIYEDRPTNDFNYLFRLVEGVTPGSFSYIEDHKNVFVTCCGRNFYKQCLPDATVHLGFSSLALMWLSTWPLVTTAEVFSAHFAEGSNEQHLFMAQSARDWETFLLHRAKELVPGGRLLVATLDRTTCPCNQDETGVWCRYRTMTNIWREMMHEKLISEEEYIATTEQTYWHTSADLFAPFDDKSSSVTKSGLQLVALETRRNKCIWRERWMMSTKEGDGAVAKSHAESVVELIRTWNNRVFANGLSRERTTEERERVLDELFRRLVEQVAMAPSERGSDLAEHFITVAKTEVSDKTMANENSISE